MIAARSSSRCSWWHRPQHDCVTGPPSVEIVSQSELDVHITYVACSPNFGRWVARPLCSRKSISLKLSNLQDKLCGRYCVTWIPVSCDCGQLPHCGNFHIGSSCGAAAV